MTDEPVARLTENDFVRVTEESIGSGGISGPIWPWCPMPGAARTTELAVDENKFGDGYIHRATRGINPARYTWTLTFPFITRGRLNEYDLFLKSNAAAGFYMQPPELTGYVYVTANAWSATLVDKSGGDLVGTFQATFVQSFNPQPLPFP